MDPRALYPTSVLKVNVSCCKACVMNLKKLLSKIDEVQAVDVDPEKGQVTVSGKVDPAILIKKIERKKKKAELLSYEEPKNGENKDSKNTQTGKDEEECCLDDKKNCHQDKGMNKDKDKDYLCPDDSDHEFEDYVPTEVYEDFECRDPHCRLHHKKPIIHGNEYVPMVMFQPPNRPRNLPPPPPPNPSYPPLNSYHYPWHYGEDLLGGRQWMQQKEPIVYDRAPPPYEPCYCCPPRPPVPPPPYGGYYGARNVPGNNDFTYFFSDENSTGCSIV